MKNINFDNPYLLLIALPLIAVITVPFIIAIRKENRDKSVIASFIMHLLIVCFATLIVAGTQMTFVMTETEIYVLADVSYSSHDNLDKIDQYIDNVDENKPEGASLGVVCFGKDYELFTEMGAERNSVTTSTVDDSATDIISALEYTATLFREDVIKRIVLITDGKATDNESTSALIRTVANLSESGIYIDAMYLDNNIKEDAKEVQINAVEFNDFTYLNHETTADVLIQSSFDTEAIIALYKGENKYYQKAVNLNKGYNVVNFTLDTFIAGEFDYTLEITVTGDESSYNNTYRFTQSVSATLEVLLITENQADYEAAKELYGNSANITAFVNKPNVPYSIEDICKYDEIMLVNCDVRKLNNYSSFVSNVDTAVSLFGKSLVTIGDNKIQNREEGILLELSDMLPVKFGNDDREPKLYGIVFDASRSMQFASHYIMAKEALRQILNLLNDEDFVSVVAFSGDITVASPAQKASNREQIISDIESLEPTQGTFLGKGLDEMYKVMNTMQGFSKKEVMVISDGMSYTLEEDDPIKLAEAMYKSGINVSAINIATINGEPTLKSMTEAGRGEYYFIKDNTDVSDFILGDVANDVTDSVVEKDTAVYIERINDDVLDGVEKFARISGYYYGKAKASAKTVLSVDYEVNDTTTVKAPLYSYWNYGNGKVSCYTGVISGTWIRNWTGTETKFLKNIVSVNTPMEKVSSPYVVEIEADGNYANIQVTAPKLNVSATASIEITSPSGKKETKELAFDSTSYYHKIETDEIGKYVVNVSYSYEGATYNATSIFNTSYALEYDEFATYSASTLYKVMQHYGQVSENGELTIVNDDKEIATYVIKFTVPLAIIIAVLFIVDVIIRKLKWNDIKGFFKKNSKGGEK